MPTQRLMDGYRRLRQKYKSDHEDFDRLAEEGQDPNVLWIACSDSRVVLKLITGTIGAFDRDSERWEPIARHNPDSG